MQSTTFQIRDPIHGAITVSSGERRVIDSMVFQRLRFIKQLGLAEFAFPGATHSRYAHSLGAMFVASRIFDQVLPSGSLLDCERLRLRTVVRLTALLHDVGHPPLSHTTEMVMPTVAELDGLEVPSRRATHEDYTERLILGSELNDIIEREFGHLEISAFMVAALLQKKSKNPFFVIDGTDYSGLLGQIISSEIDADRMDYLQRDSLFCGVNYGKFDHDWLLGNLILVKEGSSAYLGLKARAIFAFEDFLLSRYHMFMSVYLHHTPVLMEKMLARFFSECEDEFRLPSHLNDYTALNDMDLWQALRKSKNPWAFRIVNRAPYVMLKEYQSGYGVKSDDLTNWEVQASRLHDANIDTIVARSRCALSGKVDGYKNPLLVSTDDGKLIPLEEFSLVFSRYEIPADIVRIFVDIPDRDRAVEILDNK